MNRRAIIGFQVFLGIAGLVAIVPLGLPQLIADGLASKYALLEILLILVIAVVPVAWRWAQGGITALTEPLTVFSAAFVLYYVFRGIMLLERAWITHPDSTMQAYRASDQALAIALGYALIGFCLFHAGYRFWNPPIGGQRAGTTWELQKLNRVAIVGICAALDRKSV